MNKIAFVNSVTSKYLQLQNRLKLSAQWIEIAKFVFSLALALFAIGLYGYVINSSSTKGYFLRKEIRELEEINFDYNILNLKIIKEEKQKRDELQLKNFIQTQEIEIKHNIVYLPVDTKLGFNE